MRMSLAHHPTTLLDEAVARVRELPDAEQDRLAAALLEMIGASEPSYRPTEEQIEEIRQIQQGLRDGTTRLATDEEVQAMWRRFGV